MPKFRLIRKGEPLPPPPPGVRYVRVPRVGFIVADDDLRREIDRRFHRPMIVLALVLIPLILVDIFFLAPRQDLVFTWRWWLAVIGFGVIWLGFLVEFIVKIAAAESRFEYAKRNWLDIAIICLPAFLPLRAAYLVRSSRLFTLRSAGMRLTRAVVTIVIGLEATDKLLERIGVKRCRGRKDPCEMTRLELMDEIARLRDRTDAWESWYAAHRTYIEACEHRILPPPPEEKCGDPDSNMSGAPSPSFVGRGTGSG